METFKKKRTLFIIGVALFALLAGVGAAFYASTDSSLTESKLSLEDVISHNENNHTEKVLLQIEGMGKMEGMVCSGCAEKVQSALSEVPGVVGTTISLKENRAIVEYEKGEVTVEELSKAVEKAGFKAVSISE